MEQRFVFNEVADLYDQARPGYPAQLYDDILAAAALAPPDAMLEVGCGTGKATEGFARHGLDILALEPGPDMIGAARRRLAGIGKVRFVEATFEGWPVVPGAFKLVAAAQSWHWVAPDVRFAKAAEALAPGGALAVFGNAPGDLPSPLREALERIYALHAPTLGGPSPENAYLPSGPFAGSFDQSGLYGPVLHKGYEWSHRHSAASYVELLRSVSRYRMLEPARLEALLTAIGQEIEAHGGGFELGYQTHLYLARKN